MTEAMPFLRKPILLSYDPRPCGKGCFLEQISYNQFCFILAKHSLQ